MYKKKENSENLNKLQDRVNFLEEVNRSTRNAFDLLGTLSRDLARFRIELDPKAIFQETVGHMKRLALFQTMAFLLVDETDFDFKIVMCDPIDQLDRMDKEIEANISNGTFAWALKQSHAIIVASKKNKESTLVFHPLATKTRVLGLFAGFLTQDNTSLDNISSDLLSVILINCAQAIENSNLYKKLNSQTNELKIINDRLQIEIEQRRKTEQELYKAKEVAEQANRMKTQFLANVSHEMRTPLNAIIGFSEIGLLSKSSSKIHNFLQTILLESKNLLILINDLLDHAKIEAGKFKIEYVPTAISEIINNIKRNFEVQAQKKNLGLEFIIKQGVPDIILSDPLRLTQVLSNLVGNAIKFTQEGYVKVLVENIGEILPHAKLRFSVIDTGIGIPKDKINKIFEEFTQVDGSTTRKYGGTGLGTTIAKQIVSLMGGLITVESEVEKGSTFSFIIPVEINQIEERESQYSIQPGGKLADTGSSRKEKAHILLVEDYVPNQEVAKLHLESAGFLVDIVNNGLKAYEACGDRNYDLIIMDVQMPVMDGYEATMKIRSDYENYKTIPVLGMTAHTDEVSRQFCFTAGMNNVITKPIQRNIFIKTVEELLRNDISDGKFIAAEHSKIELKTSDNQKPLNYEQGIYEFGGDANLFNHVLNKFMEDMDTKNIIFKEALNDKDYDSIRKEAHKIRGGALNLTAEPLASIAERIERNIEAGNYENMEQLINKLKDQYIQLKGYISEN